MRISDWSSDVCSSDLADDEYRGALSSFTALREAGKPAALYVFPNEHHNIWQPAHRLAAYRRNIQWFDFWLNGHEDENPVDPDQYVQWRAMKGDRKSTRLNSSHSCASRMPSSA